MFPKSKGENYCDFEFKKKKTPTKTTVPWSVIDNGMVLFWNDVIRVIINNSKKAFLL